MLRVQNGSLYSSEVALTLQRVFFKSVRLRDGSASNISNKFSLFKN